MPRQGGVVILETALVLSLVLMLIFAGLEIGSVIAKHNSVNYAAAMGARYAATSGADASLVTAYVRRLPDTKNATVTYSCWPSGSPPCPGDTSVTVQVSIPWTSATRLVPGFRGSRAIAATGQWRVQADKN